MKEISLSKEELKRKSIEFIKDNDIYKDEPLMVLIAGMVVMDFVDFLFKGVAEDENNG